MIEPDPTCRGAIPYLAERLEPLLHHLPHGWSPGPAGVPTAPAPLDHRRSLPHRSGRLRRRRAPPRPPASTTLSSPTSPASPPVTRCAQRRRRAGAVRRWHRMTNLPAPAPGGNRAGMTTRAPSWPPGSRWRRAGQRLVRRSGGAAASRPGDDHREEEQAEPMTPAIARTARPRRDRGPTAAATSEKARDSR